MQDEVIGKMATSGVQVNALRAAVAGGPARRSRPLEADERGAILGEAPLPTTARPAPPAPAAPSGALQPMQPLGPAGEGSRMQSLKGSVQ